MSRSNRRDNKDKKSGKVDKIVQDCPFQVEQRILAQNKGKDYAAGEWKDAKIIEIKLASNSKV